MFTFKFLWVLLLLPVPLIIHSRPTQKSFSEALPWHTISKKHIQATTSGTHKRRWLWAIWITLLIACARPQWIGDPIELPLEGRDIMLAVDLSGSMASEDMKIEQNTVNRLTMIKYLMQDFINRRIGDRLGLILFGSHAYLQAPLTLDRKTINQYLMESEIQMAGEHTAIGEAIALGVKRFHDKKQSNKVLILLSDGRNTQGTLDPKDALKLAKHEQVTIYPIGIGADEMEHETLFGKFKVPTNLDLDEVTMTYIAHETNGRYFRARSSDDLKAIYHMIDQLEPISRDAKEFRPTKELFYWPLSLSLLISLLYILLPMFHMRFKERVS